MWASGNKTLFGAKGNSSEMMKYFFKATLRRDSSMGKESTNTIMVTILKVTTLKMKREGKASIISTKAEYSNQNSTPSPPKFQKYI